jgi:antitoxin component of MazEF toxin-antitoxin module
MERKICAIGNSRGVTLPKEYLDALGLEVGSRVEAVFDGEREAIVLSRPHHRRVQLRGVSEDFARRVKRFIDRNRVTLEALAK